ncbi:MAG: glycosyltransferase [Candidatus Verstraetearchaeota archaeon]|nr:glycosyltransferase [Candidatus Verstraetearchaeota archaeon]
MEGAKNVSVSIIVIERNEIRHIEKCLDSLIAQTYPHIEIIVVDGNSTDGTRELIMSKYSRYKNLKLVIEPGLGFAHARNIGIKNSTGDIIAFTGGNEYAHPRWIENLVKNFKSEDVGGVFGRMAISDEGNGGLLKKFCKFKRDLEFSRISPDKGVFGRGTNMAFRRKVFEEVGFFDESLCDTDDTELAYRVSKKYRILYDPSAVVFHQSGEWESWHSFIRYLWRPVKGHAQAAKKHGLFKYYPQTTALYLAPIILLFILISLFIVGGFLPVILSILLAIIGLFVKVLRNYMKFKNAIAFYGLLFYPLQLAIGSLALLAGLMSKRRSQLRVNV